MQINAEICLNLPLSCNLKLANMFKIRNFFKIQIKALQKMFDVKHKKKFSTFPSNTCNRYGIVFTFRKQIKWNIVCIDPNTLKTTTKIIHVPII